MNDETWRTAVCAGSAIIALLPACRGASLAVLPWPGYGYALQYRAVRCNPRTPVAARSFVLAAGKS